MSYRSYLSYRRLVSNHPVLVALVTLALASAPCFAAATAVTAAATSDRAIAAEGGAEDAAADHDEVRPSGLTEKVSVTASRTPVAVEDSAASITILDREDLDAMRSPYVIDVLRGLPGIAVSQTSGAGSQTQLRMRGAEANHVLVRIDGVEVGDVFAADELPLELLTVDDVDRIEIVRGPQSSLWGSDAIAGVIDVTTRRSDVDTWDAFVEAGSFGTTRVGGGASFGGERVRFDASGSWIDTDGIDASRDGVEDDGARNATASLRARWRSEEGAWSLDASARRTDTETAFDAVDFATGLPVDAERFTDAALTSGGIRIDRARAGSRWSHGVALRGAESDTDSFADGVASGATALEKAGVEWQTSFDIAPESSIAPRVTVAIEHETRDFEQRGAATPFGDPNQDRSMDATGYAAELRFGRAGAWSAIAGLRHDANSDFRDVSTYRVAGSYRIPNTTTRLRASVATGHKAPTFFERFGFFSDTFLGNPELEPERSRGYEIGVAQEIGDRAHVDVTYFDHDLEDEIDGFAFDPVAGAFTAINRASRSERRGVEAAFRTFVGSRWDLQASYTYLDATEDDGAGVQVRELRRPGNTWSAGVAYRAGAGVRVRLDATRVGSREDRFFPPFPAPSRRERLDAYTWVRVVASWEVSKAYALIARVENALDERYEEIFGFATPGLSATVGVRVLGGPGR